VSARAAEIKIVSADANKPEDLDGALRSLSEQRVNLKTAGALGITVKPALLSLADEMIE